MQTELLDNIEHYLQQMVDLRMGAYPEPPEGLPIFEGWLLKHGERFGSNIEFDIPQMPIKQCYENVTKTVIWQDLDPEEWFYAEGYAASESLGLPLQHAWLVNRHGDVIDRTWTYPPGSAAYFGIPFRPEFLLSEIRKNDYYGLFTPDGMMYNIDLLKADPAAFRAWPKEVTSG